MFSNFWKWHQLQWKEHQFTHENPPKNKKSVQFQSKPLAGLEASLLSWEDWPAKEVGWIGIFLSATHGGFVVQVFSELFCGVELAFCYTGWCHLKLEDLISELRSLIMKMFVEYQDLRWLRWEYTR